MECPSIQFDDIDLGDDRFPIGMLFIQMHGSSPVNLDTTTGTIYPPRGLKKEEYFPRMDISYLSHTSQGCYNLGSQSFYDTLADHNVASELTSLKWLDYLTIFERDPLTFEINFAQTDVGKIKADLLFSYQRYRTMAPHEPTDNTKRMMDRLIQFQQKVYLNVTEILDKNYFSVKPASDPNKPELALILSFSYRSTTGEIKTYNFDLLRNFSTSLFRREFAGQCIYNLNDLLNATSIRTSIPSIKQMIDYTSRYYRIPNSIITTRDILLFLENFHFKKLFIIDNSCSEFANERNERFEFDDTTFQTYTSLLDTLPDTFARRAKTKRKINKKKKSKKKRSKRKQLKKLK